MTTRVLTIHVPPRCESAGEAIDGGAFATLAALGDFDAPPLVAGHTVGAVGDALPELAASSREVVVTATQGPGRWVGLGAVPPAGGLDVTLLPWFAACAIGQPTGIEDAMIASVGGGRVLVVGAVPAGGAGQPSPPSLVVRLDDDTMQVAEPQAVKIRAHATVTPFGSGALLAGGQDPRSTIADVWDSAEVFDPDLGGFDQTGLITLSTKRSEHGAVVLASGETLLVGGVGSDGATVLGSMEIVDPSTRTVRAEGIAALVVPRKSPVVLRLASGEILVAGGLDAGGAPVATVEWFAADATVPTKRARDLVAGASARAFVALQGGGALAVFAPPTGFTGSYLNAWVIGSDGSFASAAPVPGTLTQPVLIGGAGGAPLLWTGDRWLRWQPWLGAFGAFASLDPTPPHVGPGNASGDPGLALWVDPSSHALEVMRFDERGPYSPLPGSLLVSDANETSPDALSGPAGATFDATVGLVLQSNAAAFVTDRTYADVAIDVDAPTGEPALVVLRDELGMEAEVGVGVCAGAVAGMAPSSIHVERRGSEVTWKRVDGTAGSCGAIVRGGARLTVGLRGAAGRRSVARNMHIERL